MEKIKVQVHGYGIDEAVGLLSRLEVMLEAAGIDEAHLETGRNDGRKHIEMFFFSEVKVSRILKAMNKQSIFVDLEITGLVERSFTAQDIENYHLLGATD